MAPTPKPINIPEMKSAADLPRAMNAVVQVVAGGNATPAEGQRVVSVTGNAGQALELAELEQRLAAIESALSNRGAMVDKRIRLRVEERSGRIPTPPERLTTAPSLRLATGAPAAAAFVRCPPTVE